MTLNELRFIVAVAQERNFRRAAEKSFISQPALSLAIQKLEEELGLKIFERGKSEVALTPVGSAIAEQAQRVLEEAERIRTLAAQGKDQLTSPLRIGIIHSVGPYLLPDLIPALKKIAPRMALEVEENITANLDTLLRSGKLDVIIIALPFGDSSISTRPLYDEQFEVVVNSEHAWAARRSIKPAELPAQKVLLLDSGHCFSNQVEEAPRTASQGGGDTARDFAGNHPQYGRFRTRHHRIARLGQQCALSQQIVARHPVHQTDSGATHRAHDCIKMFRYNGANFDVSFCQRGCSGKCANFEHIRNDRPCFFWSLQRRNAFDLNFMRSHAFDLCTGSI